MHIPRDPSIDLLPRTLLRTTPLANIGAIIHPDGDPLYGALAGKLAAAIAARGGPLPECAADLAIMPERHTPLPDSYRRQSLIFLGNLNTHRALAPLYANYLCSTDATYPGGDGFDLRTIVNPYGTGTNVILAGGSSIRGVERAVSRLIEIISALPPRAALPFLLEVDLAPELAAELAAWPQTPLEDTSELQANRARGQMFYTEMIRIIGTYTLMWSWTADERYARMARDNLRALNQRVQDGYGDWHYLAERFMRAIPLLIAGGFLSEEEVRRTDQLLLNTAWGTQNEWWRMRRAQPPLGHRHHGKGTYEFLLIARYLRDQAAPTPALRALCDRWIGECQTFLDALAAARIDDQDDESTLNNLATMFRYALGQERHAFFTSGSARLTAERALALHDNNGAGAGQGGYGEGLPGMMYSQQEATVPVAASAFYYGDGELKWILQSMPNLSVAQRYGGLQYTPVFLQKFDTGPELKPVRPAQFLGVRRLPVTDHQYAINVAPPVNVEFSGHMVNALETWEMPEGVGLNRLPQARGFDKIVFRGGFGRKDAYLLLQGYQGGFRWQGHMQAANCLARFFQAGHIFLIQNTWRHSAYDKNGLAISDGENETPLPPIAECVAAADFAPLGMTVTRLADNHRATWTRHIFWQRAGDGCFVVIDRAAFEADGPFALTCTWRTPGYAELDGRRWRADQGEHRFTLVAGDPVPMTCEEEADQGASAPFVLRQRRDGNFRAGTETSFQNLFYVRPLGAAEKLDLRRRDDRSAHLVRDGAAVAWCAVAVADGLGWLPGARAAAESLWVEGGCIGLAGASSLSLSSAGWKIESDRPIGILADLAAARLTLHPDSPAGPGARVVLTLGETRRELTLDAEVIVNLASDACVRLSGELRRWLAGTAFGPGSSGPVAAPAVEDRGWGSAWTFAGGTGLPEKIRNVRITAAPLPVDGFPDQLIDAMLPESRETWRQWPQADRYEIDLAFPEPRVVASVNILGDCIDDPTLRSFCPLPEGIRLDAETADGRMRACEVRPAADRHYKRYRDAENRLQARAAAVGFKTGSLHLRIPAPPEGGSFVLHEIEIFGDRMLAPAVTHWTTADVNGDGRPEIAVFNAANELLLLDEKGREIWRRQFPVTLTHLSCQPVDAAGPPSLCLGLLGGELHILNADGTPRQVSRITQDIIQFRDILQGWFNAVHSLAVWRRDAAGRAALVVGGYAIVVFLDPDGRVAGHSWSDGPWNTDILVAPENRARPGDIYVRCGWNHGIMQYQGFPGPGPSGAALSFGGFKQPMFRMLRRITPFANGRCLAFRWIDLPSCPDGAIFAVTELGCGVFSVREGDWRWKREGGMSLQAAVVGKVAGRLAALTGGADGFVAALDLEDGRLLRRFQAGAPVIGLAPAAAAESLVVCTRAGVQSLDAEWKVRGSLARPMRRMLACDGDRILIVREDNTLEMLSPTKGYLR